MIWSCTSSATSSWSKPRGPCREPRSARAPPPDCGLRVFVVLVSLMVLYTFIDQLR